MKDRGQHDTVLSSMEPKNTERHFLHELASPLMIAMLHCQALIEEAIASNLPDTQKRLEKLQKALNDMRGLLEDRRKVLKQPHD